MSSRNGASLPWDSKVVLTPICDLGDGVRVEIARSDVCVRVQVGRRHDGAHKGIVPLLPSCTRYLWGFRTYSPEHTLDAVSILRSWGPNKFLTVQRLFFQTIITTV